MAETPQRPGTWLQAAVWLLGVVGLTALACHLAKPDLRDRQGSVRAWDIAGETAKLQKTRPTWLFLGNSMLQSRLERRTLRELSGVRVDWVQEGGSQTAAWYLLLKNVVIPAQLPVERVTIFFREQDLTYPEYRTSGIYRPFLQSLRGPDEPTVDAVLATATTDWRTPLRTTRDALFPAEDLNQSRRRKVQDLAFDLTGPDSIPKGARRQELNAFFSLGRLRTDLAADTATSSGPVTAAYDPRDYDAASLTFNPAPEKSFLPHLVALARSQGWALHFHRVKRRPAADGRDVADPPLQQQYFRDLRAWLEKEGVALTDESTAPHLTLDWFADGDHVRDDKRIDWTTRFWETHGPAVLAHPRLPATP